MDPAVDKAFDFAQEVAKQLITLATGIIALTVTLLVDVLDKHAAGLGALKVAWVCFMLSVPLGVAGLMSMSGNLERSHGGGPPSIYSKNIVLFALGQTLAFTVGLAFTLVFAFIAF